MPVVDLTDHPTVKTPYGRWQPLNGPLGVAGFGISAIVCDPGEEFDIEHDETDSGQQEAYVVVAGRATFRIGDEQVEPAPGRSCRRPTRRGPKLRRARAGHADRVHRRRRRDTAATATGSPTPDRTVPARLGHALEEGVDLLGGVVVDGAHSDGAAGVVQTQPPHQLEGVVVAIPDEDAALAERRGHLGAALGRRR